MSTKVEKKSLGGGSNRIKRVVELIKIGRDRMANFFDNYFLNELIKDEMHNDLGASFTHFERKGKKIMKIADKMGENKLIDEINWYRLFENTKFSKHLPKIYNYSTKKGNVFLEMKYYNYPNLRKVIFGDMNARFFLKKRFSYLLDVLKNNLYTRKNSKECPDDFVKKTHFLKLRNRIKVTIKMAPFLKDVIKSNQLTINGKRYLNIGVIIPNLTRNNKIMAKLQPTRLYYAHGDIHANNILCGIMHTNFVLLDCRGKSPNGDLYFDCAYDIAKLYHDFRSLYSLIENHYYTIFLDKHDKKIEIDFEFTRKDLVKKFHELRCVLDGMIEEKFKKFKNLQYRADFTEAMLYLTIVPFHLKTKSEGLISYITGVMRLNEWLEKYHPEFYSRLYSTYKF